MWRESLALAGLVACGEGAPAAELDGGAPDAGGRTLCAEGDLLAGELGAFVADFEADGIYHVYAVDLERGLPGCLLRLTQEPRSPSPDRFLRWLPGGGKLIFEDDPALAEVEFGVAYPSATSLLPGDREVARVNTVSPDGAWASYRGRDRGEVDLRSFLAPLHFAQDEGPVEPFEIPATLVVSWRPQGDAYLYTANGLYLVPVSPSGPGQPAPIDPGAPGLPAEPDWSPTGEQAFFTIGEGSSASSLYAVDLHGAIPGSVRRLHPDHGGDQLARDPLWSPGGRWVLFRFRVGNEAGFHVVLADAWGEVELQEITERELGWTFGWIDQDRFYVTKQGSLLVIEIDEETAGAPLDLGVSFDAIGAITISPDQERLAFEAWREGEESGLYVVELGEQELDPMLAAEAPPVHQIQFPRGCWSRDAAMLSYLVGSGPSQTFHVLERHEAGDTWTSVQLAEGFTAERPSLFAFSPHSHKVILRARDGDENAAYYVVDMDDPALEPRRIHERLTRTARSTSFLWRPRPEHAHRDSNRTPPR